MLLRLVANVAALLVVFFFVWGVHGGNDVILSAIVLAVILALINAFIRPVVLLLTLPISIITLGLFVLVVNAVLFYFAVRVVNINVGFFRTFLGYLVFVLISSALNHIALHE